jgi:hypothetical protein
LNVGLRYEYEAGTTDSENRNVRGFDPAAAISIAAAAQAAYARNPIAELPPSAFAVRGGLQFASNDQSGFWDADGSNLMPRAGFAYQLDTRTVLRGGVGLYTVPFIIAGNYQPGFSQSTPLVATVDNGLTFQGTLSNPFPSGIIAPAGASRGADTFLGQEISRFVPIDYNNAQNMRYTIGVQHELPGQWLVEAAYAGSKGWDLTTGGGGQIGEIELNAVPAQYLSTSRQRDQARIDFLGQLVPNPFAGLLPAPVQQVHDRAIAAAAAVSHFGNVHAFDDDSTSKCLGPVQDREALHAKYRARGLYVVAVHRQVFKLNPRIRNTSGSPSSTYRIASWSAASWNCRSAETAAGGANARSRGYSSVAGAFGRSGRFRADVRELPRSKRLLQRDLNSLKTTRATRTRSSTSAGSTSTMRRSRPTAPTIRQPARRFRIASPATSDTFRRGFRAFAGGAQSVGYLVHQTGRFSGRSAQFP